MAATDKAAEKIRSFWTIPEVAGAKAGATPPVLHTGPGGAGSGSGGPPETPAGGGGNSSGGGDGHSPGGPPTTKGPASGNTTQNQQQPVAKQSSGGTPTPKKPLAVTGGEVSQPPMSADYMREQQKRLQRKPKGKVIDDRPVPELTDAEIEEHKERVKHYKPSLPPSPGDGEPVPLKEAFAQLATKNGVVTGSMSHKYHEQIWHEYLGKTTKPPPVAFKYAGRIHIDYESLNVEDQKTWVKLDKAQSPHRYPPDEGGGSTGGKPPTNPPKEHSKEPSKESSKAPEEHGKASPATSAKPTTAPPITSPPRSPSSPEPQKGLHGVQEAADKLTHSSIELNKNSIELEKGGKSGGDAKAQFKQAKTNVSEGNDLMKRVIAEVPELKGVTGANAKELGKNALARLKKIPGGVFRGAINVSNLIMQLQNAYEYAEMAMYVFEASSLKEGLSRALTVGTQVAKGVAEGAIEWELVSLITRGNPVGAAAYYGGKVLLGEKDNSYSLPKKQEVIAKWLEKELPGSVRYVQNYQQPYVEVNDQKAWETALATFDQARRERSIAEARKIGLEDGFTPNLKRRDKVEPDELDQSAKITQKELLAAYDAGFAEGSAQRAAQDKNTMVNPVIEEEKKKKKEKEQHAKAVQEARELGFKHGVLGQGLNEETAGWVVDEQFVKDYEAGVNEGKMKKQAALKRARELGLTHGKAGMGVGNFAHVYTLPEVHEILKVEPQPSLEPQLSAAYLAGHKEGILQTLHQRAYALGVSDAKNRKSSVDEIDKWPEVAEMLKDPAEAVHYTQIKVDSYVKGFTDGSKR